MSLGHFWRTVLLTVLSDVYLSLCRGVYGCACPFSYNIFHIMTLPFLLRYSDASSSSAADDITLRIMVDTKCNTPWFIIGWPRFGLFDKKKGPPARMWIFGSDRYEASLCIARVISLCVYRMTASRCVAQQFNRCNIDLDVASVTWDCDDAMVFSKTGNSMSTALPSNNILPIFCCRILIAAT